ncbi:hypothetical protein M407DRAFT_230108 [Tulasnella calospora MUT 4182]|uniref:Uncharacterized protein n=1 Tax=Tulasnella calospora MUT 4182 TaxID=1051891 RepID=A0A0C3PQT6_9AGAM|nr:hypothetical protein M407DRAFT_230108 [Tulasnella calospora MUT 4182]
MPMGTSGSHTGQRYQNALGLYIGNPSLQTVPSPQIASTTPTSSLLATPITPLPKGSLPDLPTSLHAELANAKSRIRFMEQNWVPKPEVEERVRALLMTRTAAEEQRKGFWSSMPEEEARVRERLERRIVELENEVRILKAKLRPVASFVDLRPKPQREHSDFSSLSRGDGFPMSPSTGSMNTDNLVDGFPSHGSLARVNNNNTTPSNRTSRRSMSMAQQTFGRHRGRSNTFGYSTMSGASQLEFPSRPTSGRHDSRKELTGPSSRTLLPPSQPQSETQQEKAAGLAESTTSTAPDAATREVVTPTAEIEDLLRRLSIDHSVFLRPITSRPSTLVVASNIRERRERARSSAGYSSPSVYSEHFSLTQSRISPSPTPPSNLQGIDSVIGQRIQKPHAANAERTDSSSSAPDAAQRECTAPEGPAQSTSLRLPAGDLCERLANQVRTNQGPRIEAPSTKAEIQRGSNGLDSSNRAAVVGLDSRCSAFRGRKSYAGGSRVGAGKSVTPGKRGDGNQGSGFVSYAANRFSASHHSFLRALAASGSRGGSMVAETHPLAVQRLESSSAKDQQRTGSGTPFTHYKNMTVPTNRPQFLHAPGSPALWKSVLASSVTKPEPAATTESEQQTQQVERNASFRIPSWIFPSTSAERKGMGDVEKGVRGSAVENKLDLEAILDGRTRSPVSLDDLKAFLRVERAGRLGELAALDFLVAFNRYPPSASTHDLQFHLRTQDIAQWSSPALRVGLHLSLLYLDAFSYQQVRLVHPQTLNPSKGMVVNEAGLPALTHYPYSFSTRLSNLFALNFKSSSIRTYPASHPPS